jgi:hypothetical protein
MSNNDILNGWKEIACYIGVRSIQTAMKYERKYDMPVTRIGGTVITTKSKLVEWVHNKTLTMGK